MAEHNELGKEGELLAEAWLVKKGFRILQKNWRFSRYEIDIVAIKDGLPHFIEVKTRSSYLYGQPEDHVKPKKIRDLLKGVDEYLYQHPEYNNFHLDILSITMHPQFETEYFFIEDVCL